jgi:membrane-associated phospholipid phosphatase
MMKNLRFRKYYIKYRHFLFAALGWLVFFVSFFVLKRAISPVHYIHSPIDDLIPFFPASVFAYCLWYIYLFIPLLYFGLKSKSDFIRLQGYIFIGMAFCVIFYVFYPNAINFRPEVKANDFSTWLASLLFSVDSSNMVTPSMHVFDAFAMHFGLCESSLTRSDKRLHIISFIIAALITVSTVLLKQHSVIDIFWGIVLALALYVPVYGIRHIRSRHARRSSAVKEQ